MTEQRSPVTEPALKPCPFCGGEAAFERHGSLRQSSIVACQECGCRVETGETWNEGQLWNTRIGDAQIQRGEEIKLTYIKRWRTLVKLPAKYADEIAEALREPAQTARKPVSFMEAMDIVEAGLEEWRQKPHNSKWWRHIDGTPIPNDLTVNIAEAICHSRLSSSPVSSTVRDGAEKTGADQ